MFHIEINEDRKIKSTTAYIPVEIDFRSKTFSINGIDYEVSKIDSVEYLEDSTCKYTLTARKYETHSWFGQEPETRYGNNETINGTITFDSSNKVSSSNPSIKQTG